MFNFIFKNSSKSFNQYKRSNKYNQHQSQLYIQQLEFKIERLESDEVQRIVWEQKFKQQDQENRDKYDKQDDKHKSDLKAQELQFKREYKKLFVSSKQGFKKSVIQKKNKQKKNEKLIQSKIKSTTIVNVNANVRDHESDDQIEIEDVKLMTPTIAKRKIQKKIKKNVEVPQKQTERNQNPDTLSPIKMNQTQRNKQFKNISQEKIDKIQRSMETYKAFETAVPNMPKKRLHIRQKLLQQLFYGVEELRDLQEKDPIQISQSEKELIDQSDELLQLVLQKLVLEIEASLHEKFKNLEDSSYMKRCKMVYMHMNDDKNLDLRRKVLTREITSLDLCVRDDLELSNPGKRQEVKERSQLKFDLENSYTKQ